MTVRPRDFPAFPHCDSRILHAPGECEFCDDCPEWQYLREAWCIAFTGHEPVTDPTTPWLIQVPCPADVARPPGSPSDHRRWGGNKPTSAYSCPGAWPEESFASRVMYGEPVTRRIGSCRRPPAGWKCSLDDGHDGPCPTSPAAGVITWTPPRRTWLRRLFGGRV